jgi:hypothetical protein
MSKKQWIKFKRGLFKDPKHRKAMGEAIWLYGDLIDVADWTTGKVDGFKDQEWADEMDISKAWVRKHRRKLEKAGYISAEQHGSRGMTITIHKWINPRMESGTDRPLQGDTNVPPVGDTDVPPFIEGGTEGGTTGGTDVPLSQAQNEYASILPIDHITTSSPNGEGDEPVVIKYDHPAIQAYRSAAHRLPMKSWYQKIGTLVGENEADVKRWGDLVFEWVGRGWNPSNVAGMIEAFEKGGLNRNGRQPAPNGNGVHPDKSDGQIDPEQAAWIRQKRAEEIAKEKARHAA